MENNAAKINHTHLTPEKEHNNKRKTSRNNVIALLKCTVKLHLTSSLVHRLPLAFHECKQWKLGWKA